MPLRIKDMMRIVILNLRAESLDTVNRALSGARLRNCRGERADRRSSAGYLAQVLVTESTPSDLSLLRFRHAA